MQYSFDPAIFEQQCQSEVAAVQSEYARGGEYVYPSDGRRCLAWDLIGDYLESPEGETARKKFWPGTITDIFAMMRTHWDATGEVPGLIARTTKFVVPAPAPASVPVPAATLEEYYDMDGAVGYTKYAKGTLYNAISDGDLRKTKDGDGKVVIARVELDRFLAGDPLPEEDGPPPKKKKPAKKKRSS
jgi:hypothetical protein